MTITEFPVAARPGVERETRTTAIPAAQDEQPSPARRVFRAVMTGVYAIVLTVIAAIALVAIIIPKIGGGVPLTVLSGSMEPTLPTGSLAVVRPIGADDVQVGDVITYMPHPNDPYLVTHRVIRVELSEAGERTFILQGDANSGPDAPVRAKQIRAELWYSVPLLGYLNSTLNSETKDWVLIGVASSLFAYAGYTVIRTIVDRRRRQDAPQPDPGTDEAGGAEQPTTADAERAYVSAA
jgi:signal peptidase